jgi:hypothetical protein
MAALRDIFVQDDILRFLDFGIIDVAATFITLCVLASYPAIRFRSSHDGNWVKNSFIESHCRHFAVDSSTMVAKDGSGGLRERAAAYFVLPIAPSPLRNVAALNAMVDGLQVPVI